MNPTTNTYELDAKCGRCQQPRFKLTQILCELPCGHQFHYKCVAAHLNMLKTCPSCSVALSLEQLREIQESLKTQTRILCGTTLRVRAQELENLHTLRMQAIREAGVTDIQLLTVQNVKNNSLPATSPLRLQISAATIDNTIFTKTIKDAATTAGNSAEALQDADILLIRLILTEATSEQGGEAAGITRRFNVFVSKKDTMGELGKAWHAVSMLNGSPAGAEEIRNFTPWIVRSKNYDVPGWSNRFGLMGVADMEKFIHVERDAL